MFHRSQRLFLRPAFHEDWAAIHAYLGGDVEIARNLARAPWPYGADAARAFADMPQNLRLPHFVVTLPGIGVVGSAGMGERAAELGGGPEIGYWIARDYWGHGFATEAAGAVLKIARTLGHRRVSAGHFIDNPASGRVLRKLGFAPTGQIAKRHSCARGQDVDSVEYALDLATDCDPLPAKRAA